MVLLIRHLSFYTFFSLLSALFLIRPAFAENPSSDLAQVVAAWVREAPPGVTVNAGYMVVTSLADVEIVLQSASSPAFAEVELHDMTMVDGMMEMRELAEIPILPGQSLVMAPGGKHLMLKGPLARVTEGMRIPVTLVFGDGTQLHVEFDVRRDR